MQIETNKNQAAVSLGKLGGLARAKKFTKEQLSEMGKKGGRPRKDKPTGILLEQNSDSLSASQPIKK